MQSKASTPTEYVKELPTDRQDAIGKLRNEIKKNLAKGFREEMSYGMLGYVVPHKLYPKGYHCNPALPLPLMNVASQKNFIAVYHMGMYANSKLLDWFVEAYPNNTTAKLDMGKCCVRFKKMDTIPYKLIGELAGKLTVDDWIKMYESAFKK